MVLTRKQRRQLAVVGTIEATVALGLAFAGLGMLAFWIVGVVTAPLEVAIIRPDGLAPILPPRRRRHRAPRGHR
jgi:hypothetical protein